MPPRRRNHVRLDDPASGTLSHQRRVLVNRMANAGGIQKSSVKEMAEECDTEGGDLLATLCTGFGNNYLDPAPDLLLWMTDAPLSLSKAMVGGYKGNTFSRFERDLEAAVDHYEAMGYDARGGISPHTIALIRKAGTVPGKYVLYGNDRLLGLVNENGGIRSCCFDANTAASLSVFCSSSGEVRVLMSPSLLPGLRQLLA